MCDRLHFGGERGAPPRRENCASMSTAKSSFSLLEEAAEPAEAEAEELGPLAKKALAACADDDDDDELEAVDSAELEVAIAAAYDVAASTVQNKK